MKMKKTDRLIAITLFNVAWLLYFVCPVWATIPILIAHYLSFFFLVRSVELPSERIVLPPIIFLISVIMDAAVYDRIHGLYLPLAYYIAVNLFHISVLVLFFEIQRGKNELLHLVGCGIQGYIWLNDVDSFRIVAILIGGSIFVYFLLREFFHIKD